MSEGILLSNRVMHEGDAEEIKYRSKSARSNQGRMIEEGRSPVDNGATPGAAPPDYSSPEWDRGGGHNSFWTTPRKLAVVGGVSLFLVVFIGVVVADSVHTIDEGTVGIYFVQGALKEEITRPGIHWAIPFVTTVETVTIRPKTDTLQPITTVTRDGITNTFNNIQVLSDVDINLLVPLIKKYGKEFRETLIFDRIFEELRTFCANHTVDEVYNTMFLDIVNIVKENVETSIKRLGKDGIKILNLVIPKPTIPLDIARNYKQVKVQWTEQLVATQQQKTESIKKETESLKAIADANREKKVLEIDIQKEILRKEGEKQLSMLENEILKEREQNKADVENYKKSKAAEANTKLYSKEYIQLEMAKSLSNNTKFFFSGESSPLGAVFAKIFNQS